jgi:hypothetical protein
VKLKLFFIIFLGLFFFFPGSARAAFSFDITQVQPTAVTTRDQEVQVTLSITDLPNESYFMIGWQKNGSGPYYGYTRNDAGTWTNINTLSSGNCTGYYKVTDINTTNLVLFTKIGDEIVDNASYAIKAFRYTSGCGTSPDYNGGGSFSVDLALPTPTPTATPTATPAPTDTPTATPTSTATPTFTPQPTPTKTATPKPSPTIKTSPLPSQSPLMGAEEQVSASENGPNMEVLGANVSSPLPETVSEDGGKKKEVPFVASIFLVGGVIAFILAGISFARIQKGDSAKTENTT